MAEPEHERIPVGIGACLVGQPVRFNGQARRHNPVLDALSDFFEWRPFCPEMAIGLGVPRTPIRLVGERAVDCETGARDVTAALQRCGAEWLDNHPGICGYVLVKGSPSCGMERVKRYSSSDSRAGYRNDASGIFAAALMSAAPLLPVEEDGRLRDERLRESFVLRVFTYRQWQCLCRDGLNRQALLQFYARHKYLVMSRDVPTYRRLGPLLADAGAQPLPDLARRLIEMIMRALQKPATRGGHANALSHIRGYLKRRISAAEKAELSELIEQYRRGAVPLIAPLTLLRHHFRRHPDAYIERQIFMHPLFMQSYRDTLGLRNQI